MAPPGALKVKFGKIQTETLLKTDIISKEYLDGCYSLGQVYPDLCASIFLMCEHGTQS